MESTNKAREILRKISLKKDFEVDVRMLRREFEIPRDGFESFKKIGEWYEQGYYGETKFDSAIFHLMEKYNLPIYDVALVEDFLIRHPDLKGLEIGDSFGCEVDEGILFGDKPKVSYKGSLESRWVASKKPFVKIFVSSNASLMNAKKFLEVNWNGIQRYFDRHTKSKRKRIRKTTKDKRDLLIFNLSKKSKTELAFMSKSKNPYKDYHISKIMKDKYGVVVSDMNVRRIISRQRALRNL